jgi:hypothetical protein
MRVISALPAAALSTAINVAAQAEKIDARGGLTATFIWMRAPDIFR